MIVKKKKESERVTMTIPQPTAQFGHTQEKVRSASMASITFSPSYIY